MSRCPIAAAVGWSVCMCSFGVLLLIMLSRRGRGRRRRRRRRWRRSKGADRNPAQYKDRGNLDDPKGLKVLCVQSCVWGKDSHAGSRLSKGDKTSRKCGCIFDGFARWFHFFTESFFFFLSSTPPPAASSMLASSSWCFSRFLNVFLYCPLRSARTPQTGK